MSGIREVFQHANECHEEVSRKCECQPCNKPAVALRVLGWGDPYPVCAYHTRGQIITLAMLRRSLEADR